jgi:hypothetical protein
MPKGRTSATWKKGEKPPVKRPKGSKNKRTLVKESIGLQDWEGLEQFIKKEGATKFIKEMKKLTGKSYTIAFNAISEFVKPKLARTELKAEIDANVKLSERPVVFK